MSLHSRAVTSARERLKNALDNLSRCRGNDDTKEKRRRAVEVARYTLEVLEREPAQRGMSDYISREAALDIVKTWNGNENRSIRLKLMVEDIEKTPTADVVPVVRCENCYYFKSGENPCEKWEYCTFHRINIGPHSYCNYGERKETPPDAAI